MMYDGLLAFTVTSLLIEVAPGPNMAYLALIAAIDGRKPGFAAVAGVALGLAIMGGAAALGLAAMIDSRPYVYQALKWAGAVYLLWLAIEGWRGADEKVSHAAIGSNLWVFFRRGLVTNLLNPKAAVFYITVLPGFLAAGSGVAEPLAFSGVYVAVATGVHVTVVLAAGAAHSTISDPVRSQWLRRALSLALVAVALWVVLKP